MIDVVDVYLGLSVSLILLLLGCLAFIVRAGRLSLQKESTKRLAGVAFSIAVLLAGHVVRYVDVMGRWLSGEWRGPPTWSSYCVTVTSIFALLSLSGFVSYPHFKHRGWIALGGASIIAFAGGVAYSVAFGV